jgi:uncharacterized protein YjbI with pentapeptide repeats
MSFKTISQSKLNTAINQHEKWLKHKKGGKMLKLDKYDLSGLDFSGHNLSHASFQDSIIDDADFSNCVLNDATFENSRLRHTSFADADCTECDFEHADCSEGDFVSTNLSSAHLTDACFFLGSFSETNLTNAQAYSTDFRECDFDECDLTDIHTDEDTVGYFLTCPEKGSFTAFKKAELYQSSERVIVELKVPASALRSSACSRKCRVSKAKVVSITSLDGTKKYKQNAYSMHASNFAYKIGQNVEVKNFDKNRWNECSTGIHCFMTREEAVNY